MGMNPTLFAEMAARCERNRLRSQPTPPVRLDAAKRETGRDGLHCKIQKWCDDQWPRWKVVSARTDVPSTLPVGCHDMTIFGPFPICICAELKAKGKKPSLDQNNWIAEMRALGWTVHLIFSEQEFFDLPEVKFRQPCKPAENIVVCEKSSMHSLQSSPL